MRLFFEVTKRAFQRHLTYRAATLAGLVTNLFFGLMRIAVLLALYGERQEVAGITVQGIVTYAGLTQAIIAYLSIFGWYDLINAVHSGEVAVDLLKPMDFFSFWMAQDLGRAAVNLLLRGLTLLVIYAFIFDLAYPTDFLQWTAVILSAGLAWLVSFAWRFLVNLAAFWSPDAGGIGRFAFVMSWFFSGFLMPLRLFPDWVVTVCNLTPFPSMLNTVVEIYLGVLTGPQLVQALLVQLAWIAGLIVLSRLVLRAAIKRLVILGG